MEKYKPDILLLAISGILILVGILILAGVSASLSLQTSRDTFFYLGHQSLFGLLPGLILGAILFFLPLTLMKRLAFPALILTSILLIAVFVPYIGRESGGAHRWISMGSISFQPAEFLKLTSIIYLAAWLEARTSSSKRPQKFSPRTIFNKNNQVPLIPFLLLLSFISLLLILQPDISTLGIIGVTMLLMYFLAGTPLSHTLVIGAVGLAILFFLIRFEPYRFSRLLVFLNPTFDPLGQGYQIKQALIGIGSGGLTGLGLGMSFQKFGVLPEPTTDSIFAIFAEETGFLGGTLLILLFLAFLWRSFSIAQQASDTFSRLAAAGIGSWIGIQAFLNIGSMVGLVPVAGIPLPFVSYGGSALVAELAALGILLNISKHTP